MSGPVLQLDDVKTHFPVKRGLLIERHVGAVKAVDGVSLTLNEGDIVGLVGESGSDGSIGSARIA